MDPIVVALALLAVTFVVCSALLLLTAALLMKALGDQDPKHVSVPVKFHSRYCANRYGSPCNCKGPQQ